MVLRLFSFVDDILFLDGCMDSWFGLLTLVCLLVCLVDVIVYCFVLV